MIMIVLGRRGCRECGSARDADVHTDPAKCEGGADGPPCRDPRWHHTYKWALPVRVASIEGWQEPR